MKSIAGRVAATGKNREPRVFWKTRVRSRESAEQEARSFGGVYPTNVDACSAETSIQIDPLLFGPRFVCIVGHRGRLYKRERVRWR